jgi:PAP2 superfamily
MANATSAGDASTFGDLTPPSWSFHPSPWSAGSLLVNCIDDDRAPVTAFAPPGVTLCGEGGVNAGQWRVAWWVSQEEFLLRAEPQAFRTLELSQLLDDTPRDFEGWAAEMTACHIERLRALEMPTTDYWPMANLADALQGEMEVAFPGEIERLDEDVLEEVSLAATRCERLTDPSAGIWSRIDKNALADLALQTSAVTIAALIYQWLRGPWALEGEHIGALEALHLPLGDFLAWTYGYCHVVLPLGFLAWVYLRRRPSFPLVRNSLAITAAVAVSAYLLYPPRGLYRLGASQDAPREALASLPGLHIGIALCLGIFGFRLSSSRAARCAWLLYPAFVGTVLLITGLRQPLVTFGLGTAFVMFAIALALAVRRWFPGHLEHFGFVRGGSI